MAVNSRSTLKEYCLRRLGHPVLKINVDDDQLEDRMDDALQLYRMYHFDGTERMFLPHQITTDDVSFKYISVDPSVERITRIAPVMSQSSLTSMFSFDYQFRLNDMRSLISLPTVNYVVTQQYLQLLENVFTGEMSFQFNKNTHRLMPVVDWGVQLQAGQWILCESYVIVDPEVATALYNDSWLKEYTTQLFKRQWAEHLKKFGNLVLPGGITMNGKEMYDEAGDEIKRLEEKLENSFQSPPMMIIG